MLIEIKIDETCKEPKIQIFTDKITDEVNDLVKRLSEIQSSTIVGFKEDSAEILEQEEIVRIYSANQKVYMQTEIAEYLVRLRLYELEARLDKKLFVRISNSEIINLKKAIRLDLSISGTICIELVNHITTFVSRRYVSKIKQVLGI